MRSLFRSAFLLGVLAVLAACHSSSSAPTQPNMNTTPNAPPNMVPSPTPPNMVPSPTPAAAAHAVSVGQGGNNFIDSQSGSSTTTIRVGQMVVWNWVSGMPHSTTSGVCCSGDGKWDSGVRSSGSFSMTFASTGSFPYFCTVHGSAMTGMVVVNP